jgi:hypothetical protein
MKKKRIRRASNGGAGKDGERDETTRTNNKHQYLSHNLHICVVQGI